MASSSALLVEEQDKSRPDASVVPAITAVSSASLAPRRLSRTVSKEVLLATGIVTTCFMGGGNIFGFSAFAAQLTKLPNSPYTTGNVASVFTIGHNITAWGCMLSGFILDRFGPRVCAIAGFFVEAVGHFLIAEIVSLPPALAYLAYGMIGIGGCQVFLSALTFADAFERAALTNSMLTSAFQVGGFNFMMLSLFDWTQYFNLYGILCLVFCVVISFVYPDAPLPVYRQETDNSDLALMSAAIASHRTLRSVLVRPGTIWFLLTFMTAGSALCYGIGSFPAAVESKDNCKWDSQTGRFVDCAEAKFNDALNEYAMPVVGNFILPVALILGRIIDRAGFVLPAFINVFAVQAFILALWLFPLEGQLGTLLIYNVANTAVFTLQNSYICAVGHDHIGSLFAISNLVIGLGNLLADWMTMNPFGEGEDAVKTSLDVSCLAWLILCLPLYAWPLVEWRRSRRRRFGADSFVQTVIGDFAHIRTRPRHGSSSHSSFRRGSSLRSSSTPGSRAGSTPMSRVSSLTSGDVEAMEQRDSLERARGHATNLSHVLQETDEEQAAQDARVATTVLKALRRTQHFGRDGLIRWNPVVTVNPGIWDAKVHAMLKGGRDNTFIVLDFDRTMTKVFLEDGSRSLDCHDILASIPKITLDCKRQMEAMMDKYYPIEIDPAMSVEEKIPFMVEWYTLVHELLEQQNLTKDDVVRAVAECKRFRLRPGAEETFGIALEKGLPIIIVSAGLGNIIEEVVRQRIKTPFGTHGTQWPNVRVLSNRLLFDESGKHAGFSVPLIHMYNKSLLDAPQDITDLIAGRRFGVLVGDGVGDLDMAHGHETSELIKVGFLNENVESRLHRYIGANCFDRVILNDGTFDAVNEILRQL